MSATMTTSAAETRLRDLWSEISDLATASALLGWDQETHMPPHGAEARAGVLATLAGMGHAKLTAPELADAVAAAEDEAEQSSALAAMAREARREVDKAVKVPEALVRALAEASSRALVSWQEARAESDFGRFRDDLARVVGLTRQRAEALADGGNPFDALLDEFEPGATEEEIASLFADLRESLVPVVQGIADSGVTIDESPARGKFTSGQQLAFGRLVAEQMGFDFEAGRIDASTHPFCSGMSPGDVRLTWRWDLEDFRPALFGIMHEAGHGLYEQGLPADWQRTPVGGAVSLGVHESQSRLWENLVGRSPSFWEWALPLFGAAFPGADVTDPDAFWRTLHVVQPSLIRVEADEATYNLHIVARFEIERRIFAGDVEVDDLPGLWDDTYDDLLGIRPPTADDGVLQDIHWSMGAFGYFPTYTLGNMIASQLFEAADRAIGPLDAQFAVGDLGPLRDWLRENVHAHGSRYLPGDLVERVTGKPLSSRPFLDHVRSIAADVYDVNT